MRGREVCVGKVFQLTFPEMKIAHLDRTSSTAIDVLAYAKGKLVALCKL